MFLQMKTFGPQVLGSQRTQSLGTRAPVADVNLDSRLMGTVGLLSPHTNLPLQRPQTPCPFPGPLLSLVFAARNLEG